MELKSYLFERRFTRREDQLFDELEFLVDLKQHIDLKIENNSDKPIQNLALNEFVIALKEVIHKLHSYKLNLMANKTEMSTP